MSESRPDDDTTTIAQGFRALGSSFVGLLFVSMFGTIFMLCSLIPLPSPIIGGFGGTMMLSMVVLPGITMVLVKLMRRFGTQDSYLHTVNLIVFALITGVAQICLGGFTFFGFFMPVAVVLTVGCLTFIGSNPHLMRGILLLPTVILCGMINILLWIGNLAPVFFIPHVIALGLSCIFMMEHIYTWESEGKYKRWIYYLCIAYISTIMEWTVLNFIALYIFYIPPEIMVLYILPVACIERGCATIGSVMVCEAFYHVPFLQSPGK